ncbi:MAG: metallophosphoesterase, partial [Vicinamibacterales bacterium]
MLKAVHRSAVAVVLVAGGWLAGPSAQGRAAIQAPVDVALPMKANSVRFGVIGDQGSGAKEQYEIGAQMEAFRTKFPFTFVLTVGDNLYGGQRPQDYATKFEKPYKALLDAKVDFYASLGNHDDPNQRLYTPYNMGGKHYYTFRKGNVRFFALDSNYMDPTQVAWLEGELKN